VHIGMHSGEAIQEHGDFLGRTVIVASRITDEARADEILVSAVLHDAIAGSADLTFGQGRTVELQGVSGGQLLYPVIWE
jgi:class 3 adenylate cyclase